MTIKITVLDIVNNDYITKEFTTVVKYHFENDFFVMEFKDKNLMINKNDVRQLVINKINFDDRI